MATPHSDVVVDAPAMDELERLTELWVALARGQRRHGSHLAAADNREAVREALARHVVTGGLLVARWPPEQDGDSAGGPVVGFVMFGPETGDFSQDVQRGLVENLFVEPAHRDEGVGAALLAAAEARLADSGADVVCLEAMADNEAARRFYRRQGYAPHRVEFEKPVESDTHSKED